MDVMVYNILLDNPVKLAEQPNDVDQLHFYNSQTHSPPFHITIYFLISSDGNW